MRARNLPPEFARGPDSGGVGANDRSADRAQSAVHIGVRIGGDDERAGHDIAALDHDLVSDARAGGIEIDAMLFGEGFDRAVFLLVGFVLILDVVIEREDELLGIVDFLRADALELAHHRRGVVVGHDMMRAGWRRNLRCAAGGRVPRRGGLCAIFSTMVWGIRSPDLHDLTSLLASTAFDCCAPYAFGSLAAWPFACRRRLSSAPSVR